MLYGRRPCACDDLPDAGRFQAPAELATDVRPDPTPVTEVAPVQPAGSRIGVGYTPTGVDATSSPPPAPPVAPPPQRPAIHPGHRRIVNLHDWTDYPLMRGGGADVAPVIARPSADGQAPVELRGAILRAAPDMPDPNWSEVVGDGR